MRTSHSNRSAFTLVEVMIAMAILSVLVGAIYGTWRAIMSATKVGQTAAADVQRTRVALRCFEQSLTYAQFYAANADYYGFIAENGSDAMLSFVAHLPEDFPRGGRFSGFPLRRVMFAVEAGPEGGRQLVLRQAPMLMDFDIDEREHPLVLMQSIKKLEMEFFDMRKQDWVDEWIATNEIPRLVRIAITTENPKNSFAPGEEYTRIISPASMGGQVALQMPGQPGQPGQPGGGPVPNLPAVPPPPPVQ